MKNLVMIITCIVVLVPIVLGVWWCIWLLWRFVLGEVWPGGPDAVVRPGYWLFVAEWVFIALIGRVLFGGGK